MEIQLRQPRVRRVRTGPVTSDNFEGLEVNFEVVKSDGSGANVKSWKAAAEVKVEIDQRSQSTAKFSVQLD